VRLLNPGVEVFPVSCSTGEGIPTWTQWLKDNIAKVKH
jgi:Ni2+-binding GTPase involved in maturation of urease and hydrogenase